MFSDLSVQSQQSRIDSTLSPSQLNSSKLRTGARHVTTTASSTDLFLRLTNRVLLVYNNTVGLDLLHTFTLSSVSCDPVGLEKAPPGVYSSKGVRFPAIALVKCSSRVYGLFGMADGGFRLERRALYLPPSVEKTIVQSQQDGSVAVFIDSGYVFSGGLGATDYQPHMLFPLADISSSCSDFSRLHDQSYDSDRFVLRCANNQSFLCSLQGSCTQVHIQSTGEHELDIAFNRDIAVAASPESATVYRNSFMQSCSLNVSTLKSYLVMTPDDVLLVLFSPDQISTYNITSGCEPNPITSLNINCHSAGCGAPEIFGRHLVLTSSSNTVYNTTIIDTHSGEILSTTYTQLPLAYQLNVRKFMTPPTVPPLDLPSPSTTQTPETHSTNANHFQSSQSLLLATPIPSSPTVSSQSPSAVGNATQVYSTTPFVTTSSSSSLFVEPTTTPPTITNQLMIAVIASVVALMLLTLVVSAGVISCVCLFVHKRRKDLKTQPLNRQSLNRQYLNRQSLNRQSLNRQPADAEIELKQRNMNSDPTRPLEAKPVQETDQDSYDVEAVEASPPNGNRWCIITEFQEPFQDPTTYLSTQPTCPPTSPRSHEASAFRY